MLLIGNGTDVVEVELLFLYEQFLRTNSSLQTIYNSIYFFFPKLSSPTGG